MIHKKTILVLHDRGEFRTLESFCENSYRLKQKQVLFSKQVFLGILEANTSVLKCFSIKLPGLKDSNFIKKRLQHKCFQVNIARFFRTPFLQTSGGCFWLKAPSNIFDRILNKLLLIISVCDFSSIFQSQNALIMVLISLFEDLFEQVQDLA